MSGISFGGYYGNHDRVRLYPPFGYSILYKEYNPTGFNHQKNATQMRGVVDGVLGFRV